MKNFYTKLRNTLQYFSEKQWKFILFFFVTLLIVVFNPTISSYGTVIEYFNGKSLGTFGTPRLIRSDEYSVLVPMIQMAVNNGFQNVAPSFYGESLKSVFAVPILDWGIVFKPQFIGFIINPSIGLSLYHFIFITSFLTGWYFFAKKILHLSNYLSFPFSFVLFFNPFIQYVYTTHGQSLSIFPWIILLIFSFNSLNLGLKSFLIFYFSAVLCISDFYPPYFIQYIYLGFIIALIINGINKSIFMNIIFAILGFAVGCIYLKEIILILSNMSFALSKFSGGTEPLIRKIGEFYSEMIFYKNDALIGNAVENSAMCGVIIIFALSFSKFRLVDKKKICITLFFYCFFSLWQIYDLPIFIKEYFLIEKLNPSRSFLITGFLLTIIAFYLLDPIQEQLLKLKNCFILFILLTFFYALKIYFFSFSLSKYDLLQIFILLILIFYAIRKKITIRKFFLVFIGIYYLGYIFINPIQNAKYIFDLKNNENVSKYANSIKFSNGVYVDTLLMGGVISGLGFKSLSHVIPVPDLDNLLGEKFSKYKTLPIESINSIFSKWLHIKVSLNSTKPYDFFLDAASIPASDFVDLSEKRLFNHSVPPLYSSKNISPSELIFDKNTKCLSGWYLFDLFDYNSPIINYSALPTSVMITKIEIIQRWDVMKAYNLEQAMFSGINLCFNKLPQKIFLSHNSRVITYKVSE